MGPQEGKRTHPLTEREAELFAKAMLKSYSGQPSFELNHTDIYDFKMLVFALSKLGCEISWDYDLGTAIVTPKKWGASVD